MERTEKKNPLSRRKFIRNSLGMAGLAMVFKPMAAAEQASDALPSSPATTSLLVEEKDAQILQKKGWVKIGSKKQPILLFKPDGKNLSALSALCTHEGCKVNFKPGWGEIRCPCHGSIYDLAGARKEGPAKKGLDRFEVETVDHRIYVRLPNPSK